MAAVAAAGRSRLHVRIFVPVIMVAAAPPRAQVQPDSAAHRRCRCSYRGCSGRGRRSRRRAGRRRNCGRNRPDRSGRCPSSRSRRNCGRRRPDRHIGPNRGRCSRCGAELRAVQRMPRPIGSRGSLPARPLCAAASSLTSSREPAAALPATVARNERRLSLRVLRMASSPPGAGRFPARERGTGDDRTGRSHAVLRRSRLTQPVARRQRRRGARNGPPRHNLRAPAAP